VTEGTRTPDLQGHNLRPTTGDGCRWAAGNRGDLDVDGQALVFAGGWSR
jgi:hypothetical protein